DFSASARITQYERFKHTPEFSTAERLAKVLGVPTPYLYCRDNELAGWILAFKDMPASKRRLLLRRHHSDK
ncbi:MAG: helix-turn-helix domain-containing protein, partial [Betaproteobacteria bacterium]